MKKNILIVNNTLGDGGAEKVLIDILDKFDYDKYRVTLLILNKQGVHLDRLNNKVKLKCIYPDLTFNNQFIQKLWNCFKYRSMKHLYKLIYGFYVGMNQDVEIAFLEGDATRFVSRSINRKSKKIAWVHTDLLKCRPESINIEDIEYYRVFDEIVCVSNSSKDAFNKLYKDINKNVKVIYNLIDTDKINKLSKELPKLSFNKPNIISIGRLTRMKRFDLIIKAHKNLIDKGIMNDLIILGEGEEKENLISLTEKLDVKNSVKFMNFVDNPYPYLNKADIFVMASDFEGLPLVVAEAIVLGKAIVCTDNGGGSELLGNGEFGEVVRVDDSMDLTKSLEKILMDDEIKIQYEQKSRERSEIFNYKEIMKQIYSLINN